MAVLSWLRRLSRWQYFWLSFLVLVVFTLHLVLINQVTEPMFDEAHYVQDARLIIAGGGTSLLEHPELGKLIITGGMLLFGDNPFGWRFFPVLAGIAGILLFYGICRRLKMSPRVSLLATFILAFENLTFVQSGLAMLDVFSWVFMLLAFWLYLGERNPLAGVAVGLAALSKLTGILALGAILLHWLLADRTHIKRMAALAALAPASFLALLPLLDRLASGIYLNPLGKAFLNPFDRIATMWRSSRGLTFDSAAHEAASRPWDWLLTPQMMFYRYDPHYIGAISFTVWALIIPVFLYMVYRGARRDGTSLFGVSWFASTYLVWIPISLATQRVSFVYYFYPAVGAICVGLAVGLSQLSDLRRQGKWLVAGFCLLHVITFFAMSPFGTFWAPAVPAGP